MGTHFRVVFLALLFVTLSASASAKVIYVAKDATGVADGTRWEDAFTTISSALVASASGDEVWVKTGTYTERITLKTRVLLLGGFAGSERSREDRHPATNVTTLDGHRNGSTVTGANDALIDGFTITGGSNSGIYCDLASPTISNCTISGNNGSLSGAYYRYGGGVYCQNSSPTLTNCTITGNRSNAKYGYGGGVYCQDSSPTLTDCKITLNSADTCGGGVYCNSNSSPTLTNCRITSNSGRGAVYCSNNSSPTLTNCKIAWNSAVRRGAVCCTDSSPMLTNCMISDNSGGGVYCYYSSPTLTKCNIVRNTSDDNGGGVYCDDHSAPTLTDCVIRTNSAYNGGGVYCHDASLTLANCAVSGNSAQNDGGGVYWLSYKRGRASTVTNCTISVNSASNHGGGVYCEESSATMKNCLISHNSATIYGGGVYCYNSSLTLPNCTISGNSGDCGGVYCNDSGATLTNCILWNGGTEIMGGVAVTYSCVRGGWPGTGNIDANPLFVGPDLGDFHLQIASPCIDRGTTEAAPVEDIEGDVRLEGDKLVDMGAFESPPEWEAGSLEHEPRVIYVRSSAKQGGDGTSWGKAFLTIMAGLEVSSPTDEVWVTAGRYNEVVFLTRNVNVLGGFCGEEASREDRHPGANETIIDAAGLDSYAVFGADASLLDGFTITGGKRSGIYSLSASFTIASCTISGNSSSDDGGGVYCSGDASPTLTNCTISGNSAHRGGGVYCNGASPTLTNCVISGNSANSYGGALYCFGSSAVLTNCTITGNSAQGNAVEIARSSLMLINCILWNQGVELPVDGPIVRYCNVQGGYAGEGNQAEYPMFVNPDAGDYRLQNGSPCIDRGWVDQAPTTDIRGIARPGGDGLVDIGAYESEDGYLPGHPPTSVAYVRSDAPYEGDGRSWSTPFSSIGDALSEAWQVNEIWVASGTYEETIEIDGGISLYGGFAGNETSKQQRDWVMNATVIDATAGHGQVVEARDVHSATLDGFVITQGSQSGISCYRASLTISNCTITGNKGCNGGGLNCEGNSDISLTDCNISSNSASDQGGGVYCTDVSSLTLTNCSILDNTSNAGGGVYCQNSPPTLLNCTISGNAAEKTGGGLQCVTSPLNLANCSIIGNSARKQGGGFFLLGNIGDATAGTIIANCRIKDNCSGMGAGGDVSSATRDAKVMMVNCVIARNSAFQEGGGLRIAGHTFTMINCTLADNVAPQMETRIESFDPEAVPSSLGGAVYLNWYGSLAATNTIFANNEGGAIGYSAGGMGSMLDHCLFHRNEDDKTYEDVGDSVLGDPCFVGDYHLGYASLAVDAATDAVGLDVDIDGNPRPVDIPGFPAMQSASGYDIGAYESRLTEGVIVTWPDDGEVLMFGKRGEADRPLLMREVAISNLGFGNLHFVGNRISIEGRDAGEFCFANGSPDVSPLPPGSTRTLGIGFRPLTANGKSAQLNITTDDEEKPVVSISLVGNIGTVLFVDRDAPAGGDGSDWGHAFQTINEAVRLAPLVTNVWVADGRYSETIALRSGLSLYGGFCGTESQISDRNVALNTTTIDGSRAFGEVPPFHVVTLIGVSSTRLDGFTITGGSADGVGENHCGGGVFCRDVDDSNVIANCTIARNNADGLDYFVGDTAGGLGGGMCIVNGSPMLVDCVFLNNSADGSGTDSTSAGVGGRGGGLYVQGGSPTLVNCVLTGNSVEGGGVQVMKPGAPGGYGGGVFCSESSLRLRNCVFRLNVANGGTGGPGGEGLIYCTACNLWSMDVCCDYITSGGSGSNGGDGGYGGAFFAAGGSPCLVNFLFYFNAAHAGR